MSEKENGDHTLTALPGEKVVTSFRMEKSLLDDLHAVAAEIKEASGVSVDRTKLMILACQFLVESGPLIRKQRIKNNTSLREQCLSAICHNAGGSKRK